MRLNRLDLIRYGRFEEARIAFPRPRDGGPDVTVILGANEAGKSTAFQAWLDLLFGFKAGAHPAAWRFDRADLLVGAELDLPGRGATVLRRNGKRTGSLMDAHDRPLNEAILSGALHGLSRDAYEERFSLDDRGLKEGGARIAGAQGDLGQLLHAGLSGLTGMGQALDALAARADAFHKKRGRSTVLKDGADRLKDVARDLRAARLTVDGERQLRQARTRAEAAFAEADAALRQAVQRQAAARAAQVWHDRTAEIADLQAQVATMPGGPDLPPGTVQQVSDLLARIAGLVARRDAAQAEIARQDQVIAETSVDPVAPRLAAALDRLDGLSLDGAPLIGRAATARADLGNRRDRLAALDRETAVVLGLLGAGGDAAALALPDDVLESLTAAANACTAADQAAASASAAEAGARAQLGDRPAEPQDLTALRAAHRDWASLSDTGAVAAELRQAEARLTRAVAGLPATWAEHVAAGLPARETLDDLARDWTAVTAELAAATEAMAARAAELALAQAELAAQAAAPDAVDLAETALTRRDRDAAWRRHRDAMDAATADAFAQAMEADDNAQALYLHGSEARQRLLTARAQAEAARARHETATARHAGLVARHDALAGRAGDLARMLGLAEGTGPAALPPRHQALTDAAGAAADLANATRAEVAATAARQTAWDRMAALAGAVGLDPAQDLGDAVQRALTLEDGSRRAWEVWQRNAAAVARLARDAVDRAADVTRVRAALDALTAGLPLPDASLAGLVAALPHLRRLSALRARADELADRIAAMEAAIGTLTQGAADLAAIMGLAPDGSPEQPEAVIDLARVRVREAARAAERRAEAETRRVTEEEALRRADADRETAQAELDACLAGQGGDGVAPAARVALLQDRDRLRRQVADADRVRQVARAGVDDDLFAAELAVLPDATRDGLLEQAVADAQDARDTARDAAREAARVHAEAYAAADTGALATAQATLLADLREGARQAAIARLGVLAARGALRRLAAERRSDMLRDVEEAFVTMTTPAWTGVDVWSQGEGDRLVGRQPDGSVVPVEAMSTGTMGQLYFALRIAGYRSFARDPGPLPMILDDIMETFDDTRARAALHLCAQIGTQGQAILFTHHAHLVALAEEVIPGVSVVRLPARVSAPAG